MINNNLAVLIDFENIAAGTEKEGLGRFDVQALMGRVVEKGRVIVARSYADWGRFSRFKQALLAANVQMQELTSHGMQDKNRADIAMVVDALELAFTKDYLDTFVIVSGDSDFTPMVLKMRELNKRIIGIGTRSSSSRLLVHACDEFIFYDSIVKQRRQAKRQTSTRRGGKHTSKQKAFDMVVNALEGLLRESPDPPLASIVKTAMLRKSPDFSEAELGYSSFARFLEAAQDAGYVSVSRDQKSGGYRVDSVDNSDHDDNEDGEETTEQTQGEWQDDYLPKGHEPYTQALEEAKLDALSYPTRLAILQLIEQIAEERGSKRRRVNVQFVRDDVRKRLRKTHPDLPARTLRAVFNALMSAGLLIHKDGTAIRSSSASFHLEKDAEGLNKALLPLYLATLKDAGSDMSKVGLLAELFLGSKDRKRDVEEQLAWLVQAMQGEGDEPDLNNLDLDDLLVADDPTGEAPKPKPAAKAQPKQAEASKDAEAKAPEAVAEAKPAEEATEEAAEEPEEKPKPKRRTRKKKAPAEEAETKAEEGGDEAAAADEAAEDDKPKRKRVRRKKAEPKDEADEAPPADPNDLDLDALLSSDD